MLKKYLTIIGSIQGSDSVFVFPSLNRILQLLYASIEMTEQYFFSAIILGVI